MSGVAVTAGASAKVARRSPGIENMQALLGLMGLILGALSFGGRAAPILPELTGATEFICIASLAAVAALFLGRAETWAHGD